MDRQQGHIINPLLCFEGETPRKRLTELNMIVNPNNFKKKVKI
jgi:hypothetical protein